MAGYASHRTNVMSKMFVVLLLGLQSSFEGQFMGDVEEGKAAIAPYLPDDNR